MATQSELGCVVCDFGGTGGYIWQNRVRIPCPDCGLASCFACKHFSDPFKTTLEMPIYCHAKETKQAPQVGCPLFEAAKPYRRETEGTPL